MTRHEQATKHENGAGHTAPGRDEVATGASDEVHDAEPDYRFTLANERTFLAWIRTSLALLAAGVAVGELFADASDGVGHATLAVTCVVVATALSFGAFHRWRHVQSAMRRGAPLPSAVLVRVTIIGICVIAGVCALVVVA
ncbi:MAG: DUF202 domain-containing protein [Rhodococcus sp. (in: high G+C Gram-positive bacteria)]|uniref:YidH family protein n=1 Tax=Rhodococcus sp. TaxID=1831 RepID=UPI003BB5CB22